MSPHPSITPQPGILDISLYVSGKARVDGVQNRVTKLSANENPYGPGPAARAAYAAAIDKLLSNKEMAISLGQSAAELAKDRFKHNMFLKNLIQSLESVL